MKRNCKICGKVFFSKPWHINRGWGIYCSMRCKGQDQKNGIFLECATCHKKVYRTRNDRQRASVIKKFFCNKSCLAVWKNKNMFVGAGHPGWKDSPASYRSKLLKSGKPVRCEYCDIDDIRVLVAHHKDHNRKNDNLKNLVWLCHNCHYLIHDGRTV